MARLPTNTGDSGRSATVWDDAVAWAHGFAATDLLLASNPRHWDTRAVEGCLAITAYVLALRHGTAVGDLGPDRLIVPWFTPDEVPEMLAAELVAAGHQLAPVDPTDPVSVVWAWLTRAWPRDAFGEQVDPDGPPPMSLGGRCAPQPAIVAYQVRVARLLEEALADEHVAAEAAGRERGLRR